MPIESSPSNDARLAQIIADYLQQVEAGEAPSQDELLQTHPDLTDSLRAFFADHQRMQGIAGSPAEIGLDDATIPPSHRMDTDDEATIAPSSRRDAPPVGTRVRYFGDYELLEEIARGGMGVVYKARQTKLNRIVALKMILSGQLAGDEDVRRFHAEAEAAAQLDHPGIVPIFEVGEHEGQHYFSMAFVDGGSLADRIKEGPLPPREAAEYVKKVSEAVAYAHSKGVIHRDLKPGNVLLDSNGEPKVTDFGLAKRVEGDSGLTATGQILGTPSYMPPEQASGKTDEVTEAADVYSLGAILYACLTGRPPFQADNPIDTLMQVLEQEPISPRRLNLKISKDLETICLKCLSKKSTDRYFSAVGVIDELERVANGEPIVARPVGSFTRVIRWCQRKPAAAAFMATALILIVLVLVGGPVIALQQLRLRRQVEREKQQVQTELHRADSLLYVNQIASASREWEMNRSDDALEYLRATRFDLRGWEHDYLFSTFTRHQHRLGFPESIPGHLRFASDGRHLYTVSAAAKSVQMWDPIKGELTTTRTLEEIVASGVFSSKGDRLAGRVPDGRLRVFLTSTGNATVDLVATNAEARVLSFLGDSDQWIVGRVASDIVLWNSDTGSVAKLISHPALITQDFRAARSDGTTIATESDDHEVSLWDVDSGKIVTSFQREGERMMCARFSQDGSYLVCGTDEGLEFLDLQQRQVEYASLPGVTCLAQHHDGHWIVGCSDGMIRVWNSSLREITHELKGHDATGVMSVAVAPSGNYVASGGADLTLRIWDLRALEQEAASAIQVRLPAVNLTTVDQVGDTVAVTSRRSAGELLTEPFADQVEIWSLRDGSRWKTLSVSGPARELFQSTSTGNRRFTFQSLEFSPNGTHLVGCLGPVVLVWKTKTGEIVDSYDGHSGNVWHAVFSPSGEHVASIGPMNLNIRRLQDGSQVADFNVENTGGRNSIAFSSSGRRVASASRAGRLTVWDLPTSLELWTQSASGPTLIAFSPDDSRMVTASLDNSLSVWSVETGELLVRLASHPNIIDNAFFLDDGKRIVSSSSQGVKLWDVHTGQPLLFFPATDLIVSWFHSADRSIRGIEADGTIRVWKTDDTSSDDVQAIKR